MMITIIFWIVFTLILFPVIWIKIDPIHFRTHTAIVVFLLFLPAIILWGIFHAFTKWLLKEEKRNKMINRIEKFYYSVLD